MVHHAARFIAWLDVPNKRWLPRNAEDGWLKDPCGFEWPVPTLSPAFMDRPRGVLKRYAPARSHIPRACHSYRQKGAWSSVREQSHSPIVEDSLAKSNRVVELYTCRSIGLTPVAAGPFNRVEGRCQGWGSVRFNPECALASTFRGWGVTTWEGISGVWCGRTACSRLARPALIVFMR